MLNDMKKIDFHIHTVVTPSDQFFEFSINTLQNYIEVMQLDAIAITNHNIFDLEQYNNITQDVSIPVFPGIEIDVENTHILLVTTSDDIYDFKIKCDTVSSLIPDNTTYISVNKFQEIFPDLSKYIVIPHYKKSPVISSGTLSKLSSYITAGEVNSPRKFLESLMTDADLVPVLFSDLRIKQNLKTFPTRQTFFDIGEISLSSIKSALADKNKVSLSEADGNKLFPILSSGLKVSTGLNVILGERSSGKSHTLNLIQQRDNEDERIKYIKQFSLLGDDESYHSEEISKSLSLKADEHLKEFKAVLEDIANIDLEVDERKVQSYLDSLLSNAKEHARSDAYSKSKLYNETAFPLKQLQTLEKLITSVQLLIENKDYKNIIEASIANSQLKGLILNLIREYRSEYFINLKLTKVNQIVTSVKKDLNARSVSTQIEDINFYDLQMNRRKIDKFESIATSLKVEKEFYSHSIQGFRRVATRKAFFRAKELKATIRTTAALTPAFNVYSKPYEYLIKLREIQIIPATDYYKLFTEIKFQILNSHGCEVSGGERSEYRLLQQINDSKNYDMLLIDEPESSFDNVFLLNKVNTLIKDISQVLPVILVTHNSTVGASIKPNYIIYTQKNIIDGKAIFETFTGFPSDKNLVGLSGSSVENRVIQMNTLEAGEDSYLDRGKAYENLKN
jgi:ABC-type dipeptide/oligopeptide/nickel transport system ATPase component